MEVKRYKEKVMDNRIYVYNLVCYSNEVNAYETVETDDNFAFYAIEYRITHVFEPSWNDWFTNIEFTTSTCAGREHSNSIRVSLSDEKVWEKFKKVIEAYNEVSTGNAMVKTLVSEVKKLALSYIF